MAPREPAAQPIVTVGYGERIPPLRTPAPGLVLANTTQIYPEDRGTNYAVRLGEQAARGAAASLRLACASRSQPTSAPASPTPSSRRSGGADTSRCCTARWRRASATTGRGPRRQRRATSPTGRAEQGIVCCWTGTGASIAANKVAGVRAALCGDAATADGARRWNDANVLALSLRTTSAAVLEEILDAWFAGVPSEEEDDRANVAHLDEIRPRSARISASTSSRLASMCARETRLSRHRRSSGSVLDGAHVEVPVVVVDRDAVELGDLARRA